MKAVGCGAVVVMVDRSMRQFAWARCFKVTVLVSSPQQGLALAATRPGSSGMMVEMAR